MDRFDRLCADLDRLSRGPPPEGALSAGLAHIAPDGTERAAIFGRAHPGDATRLVDPGVRLRVASISKMAVARAAAEAARDGALDLDAPLPRPIGADAAAPVTLRHLLSHTSGLTDAAGYRPAPGQSVAAFLRTNADRCRAATRPGNFFRYANLNYLVAAQVLEDALAVPLGTLLRDRVLAPAGIGGGFDWAGVPVADRARRIPLYQWADGALHPRADGPGTDWTADAAGADGVGASLAGYRPGQAPGLFAPQGGLRASVVELARLVRHLTRPGPAATLQVTPAWRFDGTNGADGNGLFRAYGLGMTVYEDHPLIPGPLAGHAGHALGFTGGAWANASTGDCWAYTLTGWPDLSAGSDDEAFYAPAELSIMQTL